MDKRNFIKTSAAASLGALFPANLFGFNPKAAKSTGLYDYQQEVVDIFNNTDRDIFCFWGEGIGKTFLLKYLCPGFNTVRADGNTVALVTDENHVFLDDCFENVRLAKLLSPLKQRKIFFGTPLPGDEYEDNQKMARIFNLSKNSCLSANLKSLKHPEILLYNQ